MTKAFTIMIVSKRQATIPQELLDLLHLREGDGFEVLARECELVAVRPLKLVPITLFTPEVLRKLDEREAQIEAGDYVEFRDLSALPKKRSAKVRVADAHRG